MYNQNGVPRRARPATAKVKGNLNSNLSGIDEGISNIKQQILSDDKYSTYSRIPSEVSKSSTKMSKFLFKPYIANSKLANKRKSVNNYSNRGDSNEVHSKAGVREKNRRTYHTSKDNKSFTLAGHIFIL